MSTSNSRIKQADSKPVMPPTLPKRRKLRIGEREIRAMGQLLCQRLSEAEACGCLGIEPRSWYKWRARQRNGGKFAALLDALTGQKLAAHIANIEAGATGTGAHKKADWRASLSMVERVLAPQRYGPQAAPPSPLPAQTPANVLNVWLALAYNSKGPAQAADSPAGQIDTHEVKALPETTTPAAPEAPEVKPSVGVQVWIDKAEAERQALAPPPQHKP